MTPKTTELLNASKHKQLNAILPLLQSNPENLVYIKSEHATDLIECLNMMRVSELYFSYDNFILVNTNIRQFHHMKAEVFIKKFH